ncbi:TIR-like protein FxsC [Streptomyces sp. NBC_00028]|uniref:TIR-like protein FxsC n=1 Tax=Streptomyces sp. NBC_00028 TaxID=2975624 RepID=UPI003243E549
MSRHRTGIDGEWGQVRHFFFSYARSDLVDVYLDRFYEDLCRELSSRGGLPLDSVGFIDRNQPSGTLWATALGEALAECLVFVPVYSPHYFGSHVSGQEWSAFSTRLAAHHKTTGHRPHSIVPVWWLPPRGELPPVADELQDSRDLFGKEYKQFGLKTLLRRRDYRGQYLDFLERYAEMVLEAAATPPDPHPVPDLLSLPNAFAPAERPGLANGRIPAARAGRGARKVVFVVAVGRRDDMLNVAHAELDMYGEELVDWRPYHPASSGSIVVRAQGVAYTRDMESQVVPADDSLFTLLDGPTERQCLVVLIVDPRSVELESFQELFARLDRTRSSNSVILMPADLDELRNGPRGTHLYNRLYASLGNWMEAGGGAFRGDLPSMEDFERVLGQVLIEIQGRIMRMAEVVRRVNEAGPQFRPVLTGPGGLGR